MVDAADPARPFLGVTRFDDWQRRLGIARNVLSARLDALVEQGILERRQYQEHPPRDEYVLTRKGRDLAPVHRRAARWGDRYARARRPARAAGARRLRRGACTGVALLTLRRAPAPRPHPHGARSRRSRPPVPPRVRPARCAATRQTDGMQGPAQRFVGHRVARVEDPRLLTGRGSYVDDVTVPGMLHAHFVRSPFAARRTSSASTSTRRAATPVSSRCTPAPTWRR